MPSRTPLDSSATWPPPAPDLVPRLGLALLGLVWVAWAFAPRDRAAWLLEQIPVVALLPFAVLIAHRRLWTTRAWVQVLVFGLLHLYGAHHRYAYAPLGEWMADTLDLARNHYDRVVHFSFGLLYLRPLRELCFPAGHRLDLRRELVLAVAAVSAASLYYELLEWAVALLADPAAGAEFLAAQGDEWDAQADAGLATVGALLALALELRPRASPSRAAPSRTPPPR